MDMSTPELLKTLVERKIEKWGRCSRRSFEYQYPYVQGYVYFQGISYIEYDNSRNRLTLLRQTVSQKAVWQRM